MKLPKTWMQSALLVILSIGVPALAAAQGGPLAARTVSVTGVGEAAGPPDQAHVSAGVQTLAKSVADASRENQAAVEKIMQALKGEGIEARDIQTANYSIWPEQNNDPRNPDQLTVTGYRVSNVVNVVVHDIDKVGVVLAAVTNAGANSIQGISFSVKDTAALEQRARVAAMADARGRADALADLAGVELGEVLSISTSSGPSHPVPMMARRSFEMADAAAPVPGISPGEQSVSAQINVVYAIR